MTATATGRKAFTLTRTVNAPRGKVYAAFTEADQLAQWWGPAGFKLNIHQFDFAPGGLFLYSMTADNGFEMWGRFAYMESTAPENVVFTSAFADKEGRIARAPFFDGKWPLEVLNRWTFTAIGDETIIELSGIPVEATEEEYEAFESNFDSMRQGFEGTFIQLDKHLATA
jgi:uncharacterized protein YndB with AHSA1/START domain